jgi:pimeloyl-ACP methyl ester carboxylesterase
MITRLARLVLMFAIAASLAACSIRPAIKPDPVTIMPTTTSLPPHYTFVLVHGAWAGGWEWKKVGALLLADGHAVYRPTLTGQGERVHLASADVDLNMHISDIVNTILFENLHDVVLMGHSYGGMVITGVADRIPDRIKCLVYVDAFLPEDGESVNDLGSRKFSPVDGFIVPPGDPRPAQQIPPYTVPMSAKIFATPETLKNPAAKRIPGVFILCISPNRPIEKSAFYKSYLRAKERGYFTETIESDHVVNQSHPAQLVPMLERAPQEAKCRE